MVALPVFDVVPELAVPVSTFVPSNVSALPTVTDEGLIVAPLFAVMTRRSVHAPEEKSMSKTEKLTLLTPPAWEKSMATVTSSVGGAMLPCAWKSVRIPSEYWAGLRPPVLAVRPPAAVPATSPGLTTRSSLPGSVTVTVTLPPPAE